MARRRVAVGLVLALAIGGGLASRSGHTAVPPWIAQHGGDALWAVSLYLGLALLGPASRTRTLLALTLTISLLVELSQLWRTPWLDAIRNTLPGRLLLGVGWQWADLPRYAAGALFAALVDLLVLARRRA